MAKYSPKTRRELSKLVDDESVNLGDIDTSAIDDMSELFQYSKRKDFSGIEKWNTSNVTSMRDMFNCTEHFNHNINDWDVSNVADMSFIFAETPFNQPLDKWDVSKVEGMSCMFMYAEKFNQDISMWNVSRAYDMESMFLGAKSFNQNLNDWVTFNLTNVRQMLNKSPLAYNPPEWYYDYQERFLERYDDFDDIKDSMEDEESEPIYTPKNLDELRNLVDNKFIHLGNIDTSAIDNMNELFESSTRTNFDGIEKWDVSNVEYMGYMFNGAKHFNHNINDWNVSKVGGMACMFCGCKNFNQPLDKWDTSSVTNMEQMFSNARDFNQPLDKWNVSKVGGFSQMFAYATSFNQNISSWDMSSATNIAYMFAGAENFEQNLDKWAVKADEMKGVFNGSGLESNPPKWYDAAEFSDENWTDEVYYADDEEEEWDDDEYDEEDED